MWCIPALDKKYIRRMENVLATYEKPQSASEPVVCIDEKPVQLLASARPERKLANCSVHADYEYIRKGTATLFCCVEPKAGRHIIKATSRRSGNDFAEFLKEVSRRYRGAKKVHCVLDNLSTHHINSVQRRFGEKEGKRLWARFVFHYTPTHASWLNQAEVQIGMITRDALKGQRISSLETLSMIASAWTRDANRRKRKIKWRFTRKKARQKFGYKSTIIKKS